MYIIKEVKDMFEMPRITVIKFAVEDVITTSNGSDNTQLPDEEL